MEKSKETRKETCKNCKFFKPANNKNIFHESSECRRYAPDNKGSFPYVGENDWCGEWEENTKSR